MLARNAELSRPQSFTSLPVLAGSRCGRISGPFRQASLFQRHALSACLSRRAGQRVHPSGQRGQTQRTHPDHRSDPTSGAVRRDHGARPCHRPVPCVRAARGAVRYCRVRRQLHCTGQPGRRGKLVINLVSRTFRRQISPSESRAAGDFSDGQLFAFSARDARVRGLPRRWERRASLFRSRSISLVRCLSRSVPSCRNWRSTWAW